ncbi:MAG: peptidase P60, partial [Pseudomonas sp.]|nr:peptidase P60 [Pseudomonadota bacterium]
MLNRFAPLVPLALVTLLFGCATHTQNVAEQQKPVQQSQAKFVASQSSTVYQEEIATEKELADFAGAKPYQLPVLADSILERGMSLI